jgi:hypothetical protein
VPKTSAEILAAANGGTRSVASDAPVKLSVEDLQFVLRSLIIEKSVRQHGPDDECDAWRYSLRDPNLNLPIPTSTASAVTSLLGDASKQTANGGGGIFTVAASPREVGA